MNDVKFKNRDPEVHEMQIALAAVGMGVKYEDADLIFKVVELLQHKGSQADLQDLSLIKKSWMTYWEAYEENTEYGEE